MARCAPDPVGCCNQLGTIGGIPVVCCEHMRLGILQETALRFVKHTGTCYWRLCTGFTLAHAMHSCVFLGAIDGSFDGIALGFD